jgi:poly-beta-hydroxyalkanoate depolymerase
MMIRILVTAAALFAPLGTLATAHADTRDAKFIALLQSEGITDHMSSAHAIEAGHTVCEKLDQGMTPSEVASDVLNSSSMPAYHCGYFVGTAIEVYCPQYEPEETPQTTPQA